MVLTNYRTAKRSNKVARHSERRDGTDWDGAPSSGDLSTIANISRRGFTGHEHLDAVNLIHMNGRVYEPVAGRFLLVDPIRVIGISQDANSYAYAWNDPLNVIDPSGWDEEPTPLPPVEVTGQSLAWLQRLLEALRMQERLSFGGGDGRDSGGATPLPALEEVLVEGERCSATTTVEGQLAAGGAAKFFHWGYDASAGPGINSAGQALWRATESYATEGYGAMLTAGGSASISFDAPVLPRGMNENVESGSYWEFHAAFLYGGGFRLDWSEGSESITFSLRPERGFAFYIGQGETKGSLMASGPLTCTP